MRKTTPVTTYAKFYEQSRWKDKYTLLEIKELFDEMGDICLNLLFNNEEISFPYMGSLFLKRTQRHRTNMHQLYHFNKVWVLNNDLKKYKVSLIWSDRAKTAYKFIKADWQRHNRYKFHNMVLMKGPLSIHRVYDRE